MNIYSLVQTTLAGLHSDILARETQTARMAMSWRSGKLGPLANGDLRHRGYGGRGAVEMYCNWGDWDRGWICYMMDVIEEEWEKDLDRKIRILGEAIQAMDNVSDFKSVKWFGRGDSWNRLYPGPEEDDEWIDYRVWAHFMLWPLEGEIPEALDQADEDMEYEKWINSKQYIKSLEEYNFHKLLAFEKGYSPHWIGECTGDKGNMQPGGVVLYNTMFKDRFRVQCVIKTEFPINGGNRPYAKATSPFGNIYIPNKFNGYIGSPGSPALMSIALQDVGGGGRKGNGYRWTCIYTH